MMDEQLASGRTDADSFGLLDMLAVALESWRLLLFVPVCAGIAALAWSTLAPARSVYEARAVMVMTEDTARIVLRPQNLSALASAPDQYVPPAAITVTTEGAPQTFAIRLMMQDRQQALAAVDRILASVNAPTFTDGARKLLQSKIEATGRRLENLRVAIAALRTAMTELSSGIRPGTGEKVVSFAEAIEVMSNTVLETELTYHQDQQQLATWTAPKLVGQPNLVEHPGQPSTGIVVTFAVLISGFVVLVVIFLRDLWRRAKADQNNAPKVARIRKALKVRKPRI